MGDLLSCFRTHVILGINALWILSGYFQHPVRTQWQQTKVEAPVQSAQPITAIGHLYIYICAVEFDCVMQIYQSLSVVFNAIRPVQTVLASMIVSRCSLGWHVIHMQFTNYLRCILPIEIWLLRFESGLPATDYNLYLHFLSLYRHITVLVIDNIYLISFTFIRRSHFVYMYITSLCC